MTLARSLAVGAGIGLGAVVLLAIFSAYHTTGMALALDVLSWCF
ncbi:hypothetical protein [Aestuariivita boseongensis]|nr:hypothetical protein [Aestuariivita boseongensis]